MTLGTVEPPSLSPASDGDVAKKQIGWFRRALPLILVLAGIIAFLYPVLATRHNNAVEQRLSHEYSQDVAQLESTHRETLLAKARQYNSDHVGGPILDPWLARVARNNAPYKDYEEQLRVGPTGVMARIVIPSIEVNLPIYHGTDESTLQHGIGHLYGSALPVGGEGNHSVLTGHTGLGTSTLFDHLDQMSVGQYFYIEVLGERLKYQVDQVNVVLPEDIDDLQPITGKDVATLVTCTPYGNNTHRILVRGTRVPIASGEDVDRIFSETENSPWTWWMLAILVGVILLVLYLGFRLFFALRRYRKSKQSVKSTVTRSQAFSRFRDLPRRPSEIDPLSVVTKPSTGSDDDENCV